MESSYCLKTTDQALAVLRDQLADPIAASDTHIIFEQGLNEGIRIALRLEQLFKLFNAYVQLPDTMHIRSATNTLVSILEVIRRPDLKSKLIQSLSTQVAAAHQLPSQHTPTPQEAIINSLSECINNMHTISGRIGSALYHNEFLTSLNLHCNKLGGGSDDAMPAFAWWLSQPASLTQRDLQHWYQQIKPLPEVVEALLRVTRWNQQQAQITCENGFHAQQLNPSSHYQLLRLQLPKALAAYPQVSIGKHRLSIRFVRCDVASDNKQQQLSQNFDFILSLCDTQ